MTRRLHVCVLAACLVLLGGDSCLAYGGWKTNSFAGAVGEVLPLFVRGLLFSLVPYVACSIAMEKTRYFYVPVIANLLYTIFVFLPGIVVMGELGPAHVAARFTEAAGAIFPTLLLAKFGIMAAFALRRERSRCDAETDASKSRKDERRAASDPGADLSQET